MTDKSCFPHARIAVQQDNHSPARLRHGASIVQCHHVLITTYKGQTVLPPFVCAPRPRSGLAGAQPLEDLFPGWPVPWIDSQQFAAQGIQIGRYAGRNGGWGGSLYVPFPMEHFGHPAVERELPRERLVQ